MRHIAQGGIEGNGGPLPYLAEIGRSFGHHDLSHARAHQGPAAASAALALGARAYTFGNQVAFGRSPNLHTAAHEAAHVVQQAAGVRLSGEAGQAGDAYERHADAVAGLVVAGRSSEQLLDRMPAPGSGAPGLPRRVVQCAAIKTDYGKFDAPTYDALGPKGSEYGVHIVLTFDPDRKKVNATKIGLTQSVRYQLAGTAVDYFPVGRGRRVPSGAGEGSQVDTYGGGPYGNPLYAAVAPKAKDKLGSTRTKASWGHHGWNYKDARGRLHHRNAELVDHPSMPGRTNNSAQLFESVALAVEGVQRGTYMGSVSWGWSVDGAGKFTKQPVTLKSKGNPSAGFVAAAKQWNKTSVGGTVKTIADPTTVYRDNFSVAFAVPKGTKVRVTRGTAFHNGMSYDQVTIETGPKRGKSGLIKVNDMQEGGGRPVIKLPIP